MKNGSGIKTENIETLNEEEPIYITNTKYNVEVEVTGNFEVAVVKEETATDTGDIPQIGAVSETLNAGETYQVPEGYHNGEGIVTANSLESQTVGTAIADDITSGKTAWVNRYSSNRNKAKNKR